MNEETKKLVCLMSVDLLAQVDAYAASLHINRTAAVNVLISRALQYEEMFHAMPKLLQAIQEAKEQTQNEAHALLD